MIVVFISFNQKIKKILLSDKKSDISPEKTGENYKTLEEFV